MKTRLIDELHREPIKVLRQRVYSPNRVSAVNETSTITEEMGQQQERYRFELKFGAQFVGLPGPDWKRQRERQYNILIRSITEAVYGEVRAKIYEMVPDMMDCTDYETRKKLSDHIDGLLAMTQP